MDWTGESIIFDSTKESSWTFWKGVCVRDRNLRRIENLDNRILGDISSWGDWEPIGNRSLIQPLIQSLDKEFRNNIWSAKIIQKVVSPRVKQKAEVVVRLDLKYADAANNTWNVERANIDCELLAACVSLGHKIADC